MTSDWLRSRQPYIHNCIPSFQKSFIYRSTNIMGWSKLFMPDQILVIFILCQSQNNCARPKDVFHSVDLVFVPALNVIQFLVLPTTFGLAQKVFGSIEGLMPCPSTGPKMFWARQNFSKYLLIYIHIVPVPTLLSYYARPKMISIQ